MGQEIKIQLNGDAKSLQSGVSIEELLIELDLNHAAVAVEVNQQVQTRDEFRSTHLCDGDVVEVVSLVGGG